jgi:hypothetical protein
MTISRREFLTGLTALVATPAVIRYSGVMAVNAAQASPYAIVHGLDLSGQEVIHKLWEPTNVNLFAGTPEFHNMSAVHNWVYVTPKPMSEASQHIDHWNAMQGVLNDRTVDQIIADRILKQEQQRQAWKDSFAIGGWGNNKTTATASQWYPFKDGTPDLQIFDGNNSFMQKNHKLKPVTSAKEEWFEWL